MIVPSEEGGHFFLLFSRQSIACDFDASGFSLIFHRLLPWRFAVGFCDQTMPQWPFVIKPIWLSHFLISFRWAEGKRFPCESYTSSISLLLILIHFHVNDKRSQRSVETFSNVLTFAVTQYQNSSLCYSSNVFDVSW